MSGTATAAPLLREARATSGLSQREVARRAGTSSATLCLYEAGTKEPRLSTLERLLAATGHRLEMCAVPIQADLSRTEARSLALHGAIAQRLRQEPDRVVAHARRNLATMRAANADGSADAWLDAWEDLLNGPLDGIVAALGGTDEHSIELRQNTPFAGVLPARDRWAIYRRFAA